MSVAAQYFLEWEAFRYPEGGTYLGPVDFAFNGPDRQFLSAGAGLRHARQRRPSPAQTRRVGPGDALEPGVARRHARLLLPQLRRQAAADLPHAGRRRNRSRYNLIYADDIDLFGVSLAKNIGGVSVGAELSLPPQHAAQLRRCSATSPPALPPQGDTKGPRGDT